MEKHRLFSTYTVSISLKFSDITDFDFILDAEQLYMKIV